MFFFSIEKVVTTHLMQTFDFTHLYILNDWLYDAV